MSTLRIKCGFHSDTASVISICPAPSRSDMICSGLFQIRSDSSRAKLSFWYDDRPLSFRNECHPRFDMTASLSLRYVPLRSRLDSFSISLGLNRRFDMSGFPSFWNDYHPRSDMSPSLSFRYDSLRDLSDSASIPFRQNCRLDMSGLVSIWRSLVPLWPSLALKWRGIAYPLFISKGCAFFCHLQTDNFIVLTSYIANRKRTEQNDNFLQGEAYQKDNHQAKKLSELHHFRLKNDI